MAKQIPILFSYEMVKAILSGRKTMTRRLIKNDIDVRATEIVKTDGWQKQGNYAARLSHVTDGLKHWEITNVIKCRWSVGDILWVRESFRKYYHVDEYGYTKFDDERFDFRADNPEMIAEMDGDGFHEYNKDGTEKFIPWKPSIHMPKDKARIWLEVNEIKVEKLQRISFEDAIWEGLEREFDGTSHWYKNYLSDGKNIDQRNWTKSPVGSFASLWGKINGADSWGQNPWVFVIEFKVLSTTGKP